MVWMPLVFLCGKMLSMDASMGKCAGKKKRGSPSSTPQKRKRSSPVPEPSASIGSASEVSAEQLSETEVQPKKKAVLKFKAPTTKVSPQPRWHSA